MKQAFRNFEEWWTLLAGALVGETVLGIPSGILIGRLNEDYRYLRWHAAVALVLAGILFIRLLVVLRRQGY